ncbi:hypothetical protein ACLI09_00295 [Flavobacterium sp. RHBU_24]|uniref:hypothetical protein n=1 Tax=Flavobacterium sp. RHBU_24 TaxID=3391185 RepID=UPI0039854C85
MWWETNNLNDALLQKRRKAVTEDALMDSVKSILNRDEAARDAIKQQLCNGEGTDENLFVFDLLESDSIFHINQIKAICIDYRLRFLGSHLYKSAIPHEAVSKIKHLEKQHRTTLQGFKIVAPSSQFHLENYDDPLLFAPIGNGYYYLIHKWGNDLSKFRKVMVRPMRDFGSLLAFLALASLVFTALITKLLFTGTHTGQFMLLGFLFSFKAFCGIALYYCFWKGKNFNAYIWDSPYYNK